MLKMYFVYKYHCSNQCYFYRNIMLLFCSQNLLSEWVRLEYMCMSVSMWVHVSIYVWESCSFAFTVWVYIFFLMFKLPKQKWLLSLLNSLLRYTDQHRAYITSASVFGRITFKLFGNLHYYVTLVKMWKLRVNIKTYLAQLSNDSFLRHISKSIEICE